MNVRDVVKVLTVLKPPTELPRGKYVLKIGPTCRFVDRVRFRLTPAGPVLEGYLRQTLTVMAPAEDWHLELAGHCEFVPIDELLSALPLGRPSEQPSDRSDPADRSGGYM